MQANIIVSDVYTRALIGGQSPKTRDWVSIFTRSPLLHDVRPTCVPRHAERPLQLGHVAGHVRRGARHARLRIARQVAHRVVAHAPGRLVRRAPAHAQGPQPLRAGRGALLRRPLCPLRLLGQDPAAVGHCLRRLHPPVRRPHKRCTCASSRSSPSPSRQTTAKSSRAPATRASSCGTRLESASSP